VLAAYPFNHSAKSNIEKCLGTLARERYDQKSVAVMELS
jgi:hypothetical protein